MISQEWTEERLIALVESEATESLEMEFKACGALIKNPAAKAEVGKDVSAMANAAGGTIIYGILEKNRVAASVDVGFDPRILSREWLEQVIDSNVHPRLEGIDISVVPLHSKGTVAYVVTIPQAVSRAPHQAPDGRYYKRANFVNQIMEDYEIRDAFRRTTSAKLLFDVPVKMQGISIENTDEYFLCFWLRNVSAISAKFPFVHIERLEGGRVSPYGVNGSRYFPLAPTPSNFHTMAGDANMVIHPGQAIEVFRLTYHVQRPSRDISWKSDNPVWPDGFKNIANAKLDLVMQIACENSPLARQEFHLTDYDIMDLFRI